MSFASDIANGVTGNLATDLGKWMARKVRNTTLVRYMETRLNPEQLHPKTRDVLAEAIQDACRDIPGDAPAAWREILLHPENRVQLLGWVLEWDEAPEPALGEWSLEHAPYPDSLHGLLRRTHKEIQEKKQKYFPPEFFNLLGQQMTLLQRQEETQMSLEELGRRYDAHFAEILAVLQRLADTPRPGRRWPGAALAGGP